MKRVHWRKLADFPGQGEINTLGGKLFTGVAYNDYPDGRVRAEWTYQKGVLWGPCRTWTPQGRLQGSRYYVRGALHGVSRSSYVSGEKEGVAIYRYGIRVRAKEWGLDGRVKEDFTLSADSSEYQKLQECEAAGSDWLGEEPIPAEFLNVDPSEWDDPPPHAASGSSPPTEGAPA